MKNSNLYYVYAYLDPRKEGFFQYGPYKFRHEPFYIGKGKGSRMYHHLKEARANDLRMNPHKVYRIQNILEEGLLPLIVRLAFYKAEKDAYSSERELVHIIGRSCSKTGPLTNIQEGGDGGDTRSFLSDKRKEEMLSKYRKTLAKKKELGLYVPPAVLFGKANPMYGKGGCVGIWKAKVASGEWTQEQYQEKFDSWVAKTSHSLSKESKEKLSISLREYYKTHKGKQRFGSSNSFYGKHHSEETKRLLSEKRKGIPLSLEHRKAMSRALKGRKLSEEAREKLLGKNNPMYGRSFKDVWKAKVVSGEWTQEQYDARMRLFKDRLSKAHQKRI
jgi:hypothetical protein